MADELIDIYDENNKPLNVQKMKSEAHKNGLWHRSVHVWIYNNNSEILLQLRDKDKDIFPNVWDVSVGGHIGASEQNEITAVREVFEELGLRIAESDLELYSVDKISGNCNGLQNNEFIFVYTLQFNGDINGLKIQKEEVQEIKFLSTNFIRKDLSDHPEKYTPGKEYWNEMIEYIEYKTK